ncbi:MAG: ubiquinol-cytochrome c reductase iron-sulfur subunit [Pseudomonadota bacterium]
MAQTQTHGPEGDDDDVDRRDFLYIATGVFGVTGIAWGVVWPLIDQLNPAADVRALAKADVDLSAIAEGQQIVITWQKKPVFIRHRTAEEIETAEAVELSALKDKETDDERVRPGPDGALQKQWLVMLANCTHLGCVPVGEAGDYDGWFCPCHGSHYDTAGRIRKGPAPTNLVVPDYIFLDETTIQIG